MKNWNSNNKSKTHEQVTLLNDWQWYVRHILHKIASTAAAVACNDDNDNRILCLFCVKLLDAAGTHY